MRVPSFVQWQKLSEDIDQADIKTSNVQYILPVFDISFISSSDLLKPKFWIF